MIMTVLVYALVSLSMVCLSLSVTIEIAPRSKFCFHEEVRDLPGQSKVSGQAKFKFTVLRGGKYKDISTSVLSKRPDGKTDNYVAGRKVTKGEHNIPIKAGSYAICFDNTFSMVTTKRVQFSWLMPDQKPINKVPTVETAVDFTMGNLRRRVANMTSEVITQKAEKYQDSASAAFLLADIDRCSLFNLCLIVSASVCQVLFVRRLFNKPAPRC